MKKILIVSDYLDNIGGIETYINNLKTLLKDDFEIYYFGGKNITTFKKIYYLIVSFYNKKYAKKFKKTIEDIKPDIIWFHSTSRLLGPEVIKQVKEFKGLKIATYHDLGYFHLFASEVFEENQIPNKFSFIEFIKKSKKGKFLIFYSIFKYLKLKRLRKYLYENIDYHTVPSNFIKKYVINLGYGKKENTEVLPNFILKNQLTERKNIFQDKINFIFFGRLTKDKGFGILMYFLAKLWEIKFSHKDKFNNITSKIRIFVFGDGAKRKYLLETFQNTDIYGNDIGIVKDLSHIENNQLLDFIDKDKGKFVYYFGKRDFKIIKEFLSFSHYELVPSLFLETFGLSALEGAANGVIPIGFDKENIKNFLLEKYTINSSNPAPNFSEKLFKIIENFNLENWKKESEKNKKLVKKFVI